MKSTPMHALTVDHAQLYARQKLFLLNKYIAENLKAPPFGGAFCRS
jgi:hypothetical protein